MTDFRKRPRTTLAAALGAAVLLGASGGAATYAVLGSGGDTTIVRPASELLDAEPAAVTSGASVAEIYKRTSAAVVEIVTSSGQGSGFVYDDEGHVITNHHVVAGVETVSVKFADGSTHEGTVIGSDPYTDIAVVDVDAPDSLLQPLQLADSDELEVGDGAIAIGSPFGLEQTVTAGIVSALHRQITAPTESGGFSIDDVIQTDAAINHGNSGGPLLDFEGRVIGVNSQIESESGGNVGVGFAVPSNTVERIASQLISGGSVEHAYLGVGIETIPAAVADELGLEEGAVVSSVSPGTPAADAGLRAATGSQTVDGQAYPTGGDVITEVDGERVRDADELRGLIDAKRPGDTIELTVLRDGDEESVEVTLGARPAA